MTHMPHTSFFIGDENIETVRIALLSLQYMRGNNSVAALVTADRLDVISLCNEFNIDVHHDATALNTDNSHILFTNGHTILYPDALIVAYRRLTESVSFVELNHSEYSSHALGNSNGSNELTRASLIATACASSSVPFFTGGPVLVDGQECNIASLAANYDLDFANVVAHVLANARTGTITAHPCCECMSHNEIDHNISSRASRFQVARRIHQCMNGGIKPTSLRHRLARRYIRSIWLRSLLPILMGIIVLVAMIVPAPVVLTSWITLALFVAGRFASLGLSFSRGDRRRTRERMRDALLDCEAFIHAATIRHSSHHTPVHYRIRYVPFYLCAVVGAIASRFTFMNPHMNLYTDAWVNNIFSLIVGCVTVVVLYRTMSRYLTSRQRAFARRSVSITGSSSYEPMWIVDLTHRGAAYLSETRFDLGEETPLVFHVPTMMGDCLVTVVGRVTYCGARGSRYQVGVAFKELSQEALDALTAYCSIIYPYRRARRIDDSENVVIAPAENESDSRDPRRNLLSVAIYTVVITVLIGLGVSIMPVSHHRAPARSSSHVVTYTFNSSSRSIKDITSLTKPVLDKAIAASGIVVQAPQYDLSLTQTITNIPDNGFALGDSVNFHIAVTNLGTGQAQAGYVVTDDFGSGFQTGSGILLGASGFSPCGFSNMALSCTSLDPLGAGETRTIDFSMISRVAPTALVDVRLASATVTPAATDGPEIIAVQRSSTNNKADVAVPAVSGITVGDRIFFDNNDNGVADPGDIGVGGVQLTLKRWDDINADGVQDLGEVVDAAHDTTDSHGYFGSLHGTSTFQNLAPGHTYSVSVSTLPKDFVQSAFSKLAVTKKVQNISGTLFIDANNDSKQDANERVLDSTGVHLYRWADTNRDGVSAHDEIEELPIASTLTSTLGIFTFVNVRDLGDPTKYAVEFNAPDGLKLSGKTSTSSLPNNKSVLRTGFASARSYAGKGIAMTQRNARLVGTTYLDANHDGIRNKNEYGIVGLRAVLVTPDGKIAARSTSNREGEYEFNNVIANQYLLGFEKDFCPLGLVFKH